MTELLLECYSYSSILNRFFTCRRTDRIWWKESTTEGKQIQRQYLRTQRFYHPKYNGFTL